MCVFANEVAFRAGDAGRGRPIGKVCMSELRNWRLGDAWGSSRLR